MDLLCVGVVSGMDNAGVGQVLHIGVLDQLLGAHGSTQTAVVTLGVVDDSQVVGDGDGTMGADLLTQTAADTADGTAAGGDGALCHGITGNDDVPVGLHGNDQLAGADSGTGQTAHAAVFVDSCHAVDDGNCVVLTGLDTGAEAQAAELAGQGAVAADLGSGDAVLEAFVFSLGSGAGTRLPWLS